MLSHSLTYIGLALMSSGIIPRAAAVGELVFDCSDMPEVCANMCWAVRCANPRLPSTLTFDNPLASEYVKGIRRENAGCKNGNNKCSKGKQELGHRVEEDVFNSCDEYPFASTREADDGHQVSRCVPLLENQTQGGYLTSMIAKLKFDADKSFTVFFGNPEYATRYCTDYTCENDGFQVQDGQIKAGNPPPEQVMNFFQAESGMILASMAKPDLPMEFMRQAGMDEEAAADGLEEESEAEGGEPPMVADRLVKEVSRDFVISMMAAKDQGKKDEL